MKKKPKVFKSLSLLTTPHPVKKRFKKCQRGSGTVKLMKCLQLALKFAPTQLGFKTLKILFYKYSLQILNGLSKFAL